MRAFSAALLTPALLPPSPPLPLPAPVIIACNMSGQAQEALRIYERMLQAGAQPTATTYTALISAYGKNGQLDKALQIFQVGACTAAAGAHSLHQSAGRWFLPRVQSGWGWHAGHALSLRPPSQAPNAPACSPLRPCPPSARSRRTWCAAAASATSSPTAPSSLPARRRGGGSWRWSCSARCTPRAAAPTW